MSTATNQAIRTYQFVVPGEPVPQPRQKFRVVNMKGGKSFVKPYQDSKHPIHDYKRAVRACYCGLLRRRLEIDERTEAIEIEVIAVFPRTSSICWKTKPMPSIRKNTKPDADNVAKAVMDALNGLAYQDDGKVSDLIARKRYAAGNQQPQTIVILRVVTLELGQVAEQPALFE